MQQQLFVLIPSSDRDDSNAVTGPYQGAWDTIQCSLYRTVERTRVGPLVITEVPSISDAIWTWYSDLLLSDRAKVFLESRVSGCSFYQSALSPAVAARIERLWELHVTGFAGFAAGEIEVSSRCDECGIYSYTVHSPFSQLVDLSKWDGSDVFTIWPFPHIQICTQKAAAVFGADQMEGVAPIPIEEFELAGGSGAPGLPAAWLDEAAVRRLLNDPDYMNVLLS
jgi:hypothetical protein